MSKLSFTLNGKPVSIDVNDNARLLDVLRDALGQRDTLQPTAVIAEVEDK